MANNQLVEKWAPVLEETTSAPVITSDYKKRVTAILMENTERELSKQREALMEALPASSTGNVANYDPVLIGLVRRAMPQLIAYDICGVQPMTLPTGLVFAIRSLYTDINGAEALFNEADSKFSAGSSGQAGTNPVDGTTGLGPWDGTPGFTAGPQGVTTAQGEDFGGATTLNELTFTIEKNTVTAKERALKAGYTVELSQDLKAVHGLDAEGELSNILSNEIVAEINREIIRTTYKIAKTGSQSGTANPGTFDLDVDANGRWSVERFKGLMFQVEREANRIAQTTRRGRGNFILCSSDVASALSMAGKLDVGQLGGKEALNVDDANNTFVGTLNGKYKVYIDPYMANGDANQFFMVGYRGTSPWDAGLFYCPYVPMTMHRAVDPSTFQPKIAFKTRYGLAGHPLNGTAAQSADSFGLVAQSSFYYRLSRVINLV